MSAAGGQNCGRFALIGIGMGNSVYLTLEAAAAIGQSDVLFGPGKRAEVAGPLLEDLRAAARTRHRRITDVYLLWRNG